MTKISRDDWMQLAFVLLVYLAVGLALWAEYLCIGSDAPICR